MTAELWSFIGSETGGQGTSSHEVVVTLPGEVDQVRTRLVQSLERLGYTVLEEQPFLARREAQGAATCYMSSDILDYQSRLHIGLKASNQGATLARFSYRIEFPFLGKGDKQTLNREVQALCALARQREVAEACAACGTLRTLDSRFCRRCGAPLAEPAVAELEILRMTAKSSAAFDSILWGLITGLSSFGLMLLASLPNLIQKPKAVVACWIFASILGLGWIWVVAGMRYLFESIHRSKEQSESRLTTRLSLPSRQSVLPAGTEAEPVESVFPSVTENTTELLEAQPVRLPEQSRNTR
ncbi:MAG: zinc ribbon domain-containing protein [Blastocatellia bacterium]|nr:zinc ribbon domain-containing protein [Blastocatellia bacterium]